jgi:hypothetical protein
MRKGQIWSRNQVRLATARAWSARAMSLLRARSTDWIFLEALDTNKFEPRGKLRTSKVCSAR